MVSVPRTLSRRQGRQIWNTVFMGEMSHDVGGPYRYEATPPLWVKWWCHHHQHHHHHYHRHGLALLTCQCLLFRCSRECFAAFCAELQSSQLPLLVPCPNNVHDVGQNRETWVPNPRATSPTALMLFEALGILMGIAIRNREYLHLELPSLVWKSLAGLGAITLEDLREVGHAWRCPCLVVLILTPPHTLLHRLTFIW